MSQPSHTPGPWRTGLPRWIDDAKGRPLACAFSRKQWSTMDETEANGRLIAAAPDLLAALKLLVSNAATSPSTSEGVRRLRTAVDVARAAIAAAQPEAPHREAGKENP